jgi:hypothetical protein
VCGGCAQERVSKLAANVQVGRWVPGYDEEEDEIRKE